MTLTRQTVLLVGATGMLGSQIAGHTLEGPQTRLRLLVRPGTTGNPDKNGALTPLLERGAEIIEGDLVDRSSLDRATEGVDVIVSAVQGGPEVIVDGQVALAEAGHRNGVRRILPSDFALDLFKATPGEHKQFDLRRTANEAIASLGMEHIHILQGGFMDVFKPGAGFIGEDGVVRFWGDGSRPIEVTTVDDTARMTARIALDRRVPSGKFAFCGDRVSILDATRVIEAETGRTYERRSLGSEADLRSAMAEAADDRSDPARSVILAYALYMLTGQTALSDLQNARYPDMTLDTFAAFAAHMLTDPAKAA